jgi:hypothetical protein
MTAGGYRVRAAVFKGVGGVYHPAGHDNGSKRRGRPIAPPPPYKPPAEQVRVVSTYAQARQLVRELRAEHGADAIVFHVERIEPAPAEPRPVQTSLTELGGWPRQKRGNDQ